MSAHDALLKSLDKSFKLYLDHGARSTRKLEEFHGYFHGQVESRLSSAGVRGLRVKSMSNGEETAEGSYYPKKVDVAVVRGGSCLGAISLKFVTSNYKQNANNYFEHMMGETANLRSKGLVYGAFSVIPRNPQYLTKVSGGGRGEAKKTETLARRDVLKYINLHQSGDADYRPSPLGLLLVEVDADSIKAASLDGLSLSSAEKDTMTELGDVDSFLNSFVTKVLALV